MPSPPHSPQTSSPPAPRHPKFVPVIPKPHTFLLTRPNFCGLSPQFLEILGSSGDAFPFLFSRDLFCLGLSQSVLSCLVQYCNFQSVCFLMRLTLFLLAGLVWSGFPSCLSWFCLVTSGLMIPNRVLSLVSSHSALLTLLCFLWSVLSCLTFLVWAFLVISSLCLPSLVLSRLVRIVVICFASFCHIFSWVNSLLCFA